MKSVIKSSNGLVRELEIEIPAETVDAAFAETYQKYRREAKIPGFRPGKTPLNVIRSRFGDAIRDDVLEELIKKSYPQAIKEQNLNVASYPNIPEYELNEGAALKYVARVEVMPEVEKVEYDGLNLPDEKIEISDIEVNSVIDYLKKKHAELRPVERAATADDILVMDLIKLDDPDKILKGDQFSDNEVDLSSSMTVKEFREGLAGLKAGDEKEVTVNYPPDYSDEHFAGKTLKYLCKIKGVKERVLPEENDALAKLVGGAETLLELRLKIREDLKKQRENDQDKWKRNEVVQQILEKNPVPIPEAMAQNYLDSVIEDYKKNYEKFDEKVIRERYHPVAVKALRWNFLSNRLAELEKIEVLPLDTENWIKRFADNYQMDIEKAKEVLGKSGRVKEIRDSILEDKIFDFLFSKVAYLPPEQWKREKEHPDEKEL